MKTAILKKLAEHGYKKRTIDKILDWYDVITRRSSYEITAEILSLCKQPQDKTQLIYSMNLSRSVLQKYLSQSQSLGLLKVHHCQTRYTTTPKGLEFIEKWKKIEEVLTILHAEQS